VANEAQGKIEPAEQAYNKALAIEPGNKTFIEDIAQIRNAFRGSLPSDRGGSQALAEPSKPSELVPKVIKVEATGEVYINIGNKSGVKVGDKMVVYGEKEIRNPDTGEVMGVDTFDKAEMTVTKVMENISLCKVVKALNANKIVIKDKVKTQK